MILNKNEGNRSLDRGNYQWHKVFREIVTKICVLSFLKKIFNIFRSVSEEAQPLTWMFWQKRRYIVVLLAFLGYVANYSLRVNLSVAIVEMTKNRTVQYEDGTVGYVWNSLCY